LDRGSCLSAKSDIDAGWGSKSIRGSGVAAFGRCTARNTTQQERRNTLEFSGEIAISHPKW
jgi:hypothetical protein